MVDALRSRIMRANRGRDTKPELALRLALHAQGLRYRIANRSLPGTPDLVFPRYRTAVFVHGCYWHHHTGCSKATTPKSNTEFWLDKFRTNQKRDRRNNAMLLEGGWRIGLVWECAVSDEVALELGEFVKCSSPAFCEWPQPSDAPYMGFGLELVERIHHIDEPTSCAIADDRPRQGNGDMGSH